MLNLLLDVNLLVDPLTCLLGYVHFSVLKPTMQITVVLALLVAYGQIGFKWTFFLPPTLTGYSIIISVFTSIMRNILSFFETH